MIDSLTVDARSYLVSDKNGRYVIVLKEAEQGTAFIPSQNQHAVIYPSPIDISIHITLEPGIPGRDAPVMHVVYNVGNDQGDRRQPAVIRREARKRHIGCRGDVDALPVNGRVVLAVIAAVDTAGETDRRHRFAINSEAQASGEKFAPEIWIRKRMRTGVVIDSLGRT